MRFDFTDLNLFRHIVEAGSITHGAERSNLALAAASTRIRKMELAFGTALLVRGGQGSRPRLRAVRSCSMPGEFWRKPSACRRTSRPLREVSPARCGCSPIPMPLPNFFPRR